MTHQNEMYPTDASKKRLGVHIHTQDRAQSTHPDTYRMLSLLVLYDRILSQNRKTQCDGRPPT